MQAHSLSTSAARNHIAPSGPSNRTADLLKPDLPLQSFESLASRPVTVNARPSLAAASGIANTCGLAHDADNLLAALGLYSDLLARPGVLRPEHAHYATELRGIAERSGRLMRNLIPRIHADPEPERASVGYSEQPLSDPAEALLELEPLLHAIAAPHSVSLQTPPSLPQVPVSREYLERILVNLVRNAAQAIERKRSPKQPSCGHICISLAAFAGSLQLMVEDDGPGIPLIAAAAFLSPSPLPPGATHGLGHRIVHELVAATGGTLSVSARPNRGTRFTLQWPIVSVRPTDSCFGKSPAPPASLYVSAYQEIQEC